MAFPFRITAGGAAQTGRMAHIAQMVEQVLFTSPGERVFRPEWGFGARAFVFEPNRAPVWDLAQNRLMAALADVLAGEVDPKTICVSVGADPDSPERLVVRIDYVVAALQRQETLSLKV